MSVDYRPSSSMYCFKANDCTCNLYIKCLFLLHIKLLQFSLYLNLKLQEMLMMCELKPCTGLVSITCFSVVHLIFYVVIYYFLVHFCNDLPRNEYKKMKKLK